MKRKKLYLVIIGPSGSGKGTQAKLLTDKFGLIHISMGDLLREQIQSKTEVGKRIAIFVNQGRWVPDGLVFQIIQPFLKKGSRQGFIIDGFPRTISQAEILEKFLAKEKITLDAVLLLEIRPEVILARREKVIKEGRKFQENRADDSPEIFKRRFKSYQKTINPILRFYEKRNLLIKVDGERPIKDIFQDILVRLKAL